MQFSERWLRTFVDPALDTGQLAHLITMAGLEVEALEPAAPAFSGVVVAEILSAEKHPDADRLQVCQVNVGEAEPVQIVCGAANARAGLKAPLARAGALLPGNFAIKQAKVRGVESFGMLCSAKELGLAAEASGLLELPAEAPVGQSIRDYLDLDDTRLTLKLTPNLAYCLSIQGIAREIAALTAAPFTPADCTPLSASIDATQPIVVAAPDACPRYCGRVVRGIRTDIVTPDWMLRRIERSGLRGLHPVVDITNYVLLELGQPMHAFDLAKLNGVIQVRLATDGEKVELLNGETIEVQADTLLIADDNGALALAGVMGGASSAVSADTVDLFLETAHFTPAAVAGRARRYGLATDSSHRFERGVDPALTVLAMERATRLILDICGGEAGPLVMVGGEAAPPRPVAFRPERARRVLGISIDDDAMRGHLERLGMRIEIGTDIWQVTAPSWRFDIEREVDLIEDVARMQGYDAIPATVPVGVAAMLPAPESVRGTQTLKHVLADAGYQEIVTYSFIPAELDALFRSVGAPIPLLNPIAAHQSHMRGSLMPGLIQALRHNLNYGQGRLRLFEFGRCFLTPDVDGQPLRVAGLTYGAQMPEQWGETGRQADFFDVKGDLERLLPADVCFVAGGHAALHPGRSAGIHLDGRIVGWLGALHPRLVQQLDLAQAPILFELDIDVLRSVPLPRYQRLSRFPAVRRDLAVLIDADVAVGDLLAGLRADKPTLIASIDLFDVYAGKGIEEGKKSLAFSMLIQHTEKTLTDAEIEAAVENLLQTLIRDYGVTLRS